jgi:rSAM/selenodomain-associated transferase 1
LADPESSKLAPASRARRGSEDSTTQPRQLGLFAKLPAPGEVKTRLTPPLTPDEASRLYSAFLEDMDRLPATVGDCDSTLFLVRNSDTGACERLLPGWRHAWQSAGDLGARLERALREMHSLGGRAVIVGSDHPDLPADLIHRAFAALTDHDLVLGPTPDGGYYLIGTAGPQPGLFDGVEWSTSRTAEQTEYRAGERGLSVARLGSWPDVDTWEDVLALSGRLDRGAGRAPATARALAPLLEKYGRS